MSSRIERERKTVDAMLRLFCRAHHGRSDGLCESCAALREYAHLRLQKCPYQEQKPVCAKCPVHCYKPEMRERVRTVMRYAGPRLLFRHPLLALRHLWDERRPHDLHRVLSARRHSGRFL